MRCTGVPEPPRLVHPCRGADEGGLLTTCYVGALVLLPPLTAAAAFDAEVVAVRELVCGPGATPGCLRSRYATLVGRRPPRWLAVEMTLEPWDGERCELGIRPRREVLVDPDRQRARWYLGTAVLLLDKLALAMEHWALAPPEPAGPRRAVAVGVST